MIKLLFLDIDGVLNDHAFNKEADCCGIDDRPVKHLNQIIRATNCNIIISSAWRYLILNGAMTLQGFEYMMRTHGVAKEFKIHGVTPADEIYINRVEQVERYLNEHKPDRYAILDDMEFEFKNSKHKDNFVHVETGIGLIAPYANKVIEILNS